MSSTSSNSPGLAMPYRESEGSKQAKLCSDNSGARLTKSGAGMENPRRAIP